MKPLEISSAEGRRYNRLSQRGWRLMERALQAREAQAPSQLGFWAERQLRRARRSFEKAIAIHPSSWSARWGLGKVDQSLGEHRSAFHNLRSAQELAQDHPDLAREASIEAARIGQLADAVRLGERALDLAPDDSGLRANLAMYNCLAGLGARALKLAAEAHKQSPADPVVRDVFEFIEEVERGDRPRPKTLSEAEQTE